ncbi:hypothetical protein FISHEDRAFT_61613 [Fistulina hepatica ATCC 64428]|uniref:Uncharacterized protein n=1 Tax=Fistulina hepatica ATCC 64428 TaxID=1128425 RepID=A0A0D7A4B9_9AGAR|nr:hypothetical protein FISHEDRAFT_61613 [Fistulina hepatica ATCC 64428]
MARTASISTIIFSAAPPPPTMNSKRSKKNRHHASRRLSQAENIAPVRRCPSLSRLKQRRRISHLALKPAASFAALPSIAGSPKTARSRTSTHAHSSPDADVCMADPVSLPKPIATSASTPTPINAGIPGPGSTVTFRIPRSLPMPPFHSAAPTGGPYNHPSSSMSSLPPTLASIDATSSHLVSPSTLALVDPRLATVPAPFVRDELERVGKTLLYTVRNTLVPRLPPSSRAGASATMTRSSNPSAANPTSMPITNLSGVPITKSNTCPLPRTLRAVVVPPAFPAQTPLLPSLGMPAMASAAGLVASADPTTPSPFALMPPDVILAVHGPAQGVLTAEMVPTARVGFPSTMQSQNSTLTPVQSTGTSTPATAAKQKTTQVTLYPAHALVFAAHCTRVMPILPQTATNAGDTGAEGESALPTPPTSQTQASTSSMQTSQSQLDASAAALLTPPASQSIHPIEPSPSSLCSPTTSSSPTTPTQPLSATPSQTTPHPNIARPVVLELPVRALHVPAAGAAFGLFFAWLYAPDVRALVRGVLGDVLSEGKEGEVDGNNLDGRREKDKVVVVIADAILSSRPTGRRQTPILTSSQSNTPPWERPQCSTSDVPQWIAPALARAAPLSVLLRALARAHGVWADAAALGVEAPSPSAAYMPSTLDVPEHTVADGTSTPTVGARSVQNVVSSGLRPPAPAATGGVPGVWRALHVLWDVLIRAVEVRVELDATARTDGTSIVQSRCVGGDNSSHSTQDVCAGDETPRAGTPRPTAYTLNEETCKPRQEVCAAEERLRTPRKGKMCPGATWGYSDGAGSGVKRGRRKREEDAMYVDDDEQERTPTRRR